MKEKSIYFLLAPSFVEFPYKIIENLRKDGFKINASGFVTGDKKSYEKAKSLFDNVKFLNDFEKKFTIAKYDFSKIQHYRKKLGDEALNNIIIADRHLGNGFVQGANQFQTKLRKLVQDDNLLSSIYVVELLDLIFREFNEKKPDFVFCYVVGGAPGLAMALVANYLGIKFACLVPTRIKDRVHLDESYNYSLKLISERYKDIIDKEITINEEAKKYLQDFINKPIKPKYEDLNEKIFRKSNSYNELIKNLIRLLYHYFKSYFTEENFRQSYKNIFIKLKAIINIKFNRQSFDKVNLKDKFVYYPLHVDPELSTMVMSPMHTNQLSIIEAISKSIPFDSFLYVKENIHMWGKRPNDFYKKIKQFPKIKLIHPLEDNFALIKSSYVVTTVTGTSGWEGMLLKKPVIFLGNSPFLILDKGYILCRDLSNLSNIFKQIDQIEHCSDEELLKYLTILYENSFSMPSELLWGGKDRNKSLEENEKTIQIVADEFKKFLN